MNIKQFKNIVYPTIGRITSAVDLQNMIVKKVWKTYAAMDDKTGRSEAYTLRPTVFYCYVDEHVYREWRARNLTLADYDVCFTPEYSGIFKVTLQPTN